MQSCLLFHGPGAKLAACSEASKIGHLMVPPIGDSESGLKVDDVRAAVRLITSTPLGSSKGVVVIGPMDGTATLRSADALLKTIEDGGSDFVVPVLWAHDLGGVPLTIRSRCLERWADELEVQGDVNDELSSAAWSAVAAALKKDYSALLSATKIITSKEAKTGPFLNALVECLSTKLEDPEYRKLWEQLRPVTKGKDLMPLELVAVLMGA